MMEKLFLQILNMSYVGSIVILFILVVRMLFKKVPRKYSYLLWTVALVRLIVPFSFESILSLIFVNPAPITNDILYMQTPHISTGISNIDQSISALLPVADTVASVNPMQVWIFIGSLLWIIGIAVLLICGMVSFIKLKRKLDDAARDKDNVYFSSNVDTPFVLGLIQPKIYLPASMSECEKEYILLHEQTHIKRFDHIIRFISYLVLCIHWFNPLVWIAFWLSGKDMEMSCDELVISKLGQDIKKDYSQSLLNFATGRRHLGITPLAFGEGDTKGRIKNILNFRKPKFYAVVVAIIILLVAAFGLLANPKDEEPDLSLLNIDNFLSAMATGGDIAVETENNGTLIISPNANFLKLFEQKEWKEKNVVSPLESAATLKFILNEGYYIRFYSYEDYAMIYSEANQDKYRYYTIPKGVYDNLNSYVLENGRIVNDADSFAAEMERDNQDAPRLFDNWIQKPSKDPVEVVQDAIENQIDKDYTIAVRFGAAEIDSFETERVVERYSGSELADKRGWTDTYLTEHFLVVKASYYVEYDHTKTFMSDGDLEQYFYLTRDTHTGLWTIIDNSSAASSLTEIGGVDGPTSIRDNMSGEATNDYYKNIGFISGFEESSATCITFDPIEWITLEDTDRIEELGIEENNDMPNGYYIYNPEIEEIEYEVDEYTEYRFHYSTTDKEEFTKYLNTYSNKAVNVPFWITVKDGVVQVIEEQYVP